MKKERYHLLDTLRGSVLLSMILYHGCWNMVYIYGKNWEWYRSQGAYIWQQSICWTFICLSGFCFSLGKNHLKNGFLVFGSGLLVTLTTMVIMPSNRVIFGVLTCIGSCILLTHFMKNLIIKIPANVGVFLNILLFLFTKNTNNGSWGIGNMKITELPQTWYQNYFTTFLGFPFRGFYSTDYFSLVPWFFLFLTGFYFFRIWQKKGWLERTFLKVGIAPLSFLGRHSLLIYLLHQPVLYGVMQILHG